MRTLSAAESRSRPLTPWGGTSLVRSAVSGRALIASSSDSERWSFDSLGELSLLADRLVHGAGGVLGDAAAEEEPERQSRILGGAESERGLVLIELTRSDVP